MRSAVVESPGPAANPYADLISDVDVVPMRRCATVGEFGPALKGSGRPYELGRSRADDAAIYTIDAGTVSMV